MFSRSSSQASENMIYAELQITPDTNSHDPDYEVVDFQSVKLPPKKKEKAKTRNNNKAPVLNIKLCSIITF